MLEKKIVLTNKYGEDEADALAKELGLSPLLVEILLRRGINNIEFWGQGLMEVTYQNQRKVGV